MNSRENDFEILWSIEAMLKSRKQSLPSNSYAAKLFNAGLNKILDKLGEEVTEFMVAAAAKDKEQIVYEAADAWFHLLLLAVFMNVPLEHILSSDEKTAHLQSTDMTVGSSYRSLSGHLADAIFQSAEFDGSSKRYAEVAASYSGLFFDILAVCRVSRLDYTDIEQELISRMSPKQKGKQDLNKRQDVH